MPVPQQPGTPAAPGPAPADWSVLSRWRPDVVSTLSATIGRACGEGTALQQAVVEIALPPGEPGRRVPGNRLFALAVLGAATGDPTPAVPVAALSHLWWSGAEWLDDLADSSARSGGAVRHGIATTAAITCLGVLPVSLVRAARIEEPVRGLWIDEVVAGSLHAAQGQLSDLARDAGSAGWATVMRGYVGKTGAAYARDAVMAAALGTRDGGVLRAWRAFGSIFGILRQLDNDNTGASPDENEDLRNGTPTLRIASALAGAGHTAADGIVRLWQACPGSARARAELHALLSRDDVRSEYLGRIGVLRRHAHDLLASITPPSPYRSALHGRIDLSVAAAVPRAGAGARDG